MAKITKKKPYNLNNLSLKKSIEITKFIGSGEDLFFSLIYLSKKYNNFYFPIGNISNYNNDLMWNICISLICTKKKFKIKLPDKNDIYFKKIKKYIDNYQNNKKKKFILIPIYLISKTCDIYKGHFNILIFNIESMTIERFEPYGSVIMLKQHKEFDKQLKNIFLKNNIKIKLKTHKDFMNKKSFQTIDEDEITNGISSLRNTDPGGFCIAWGIWFCNMKLKYPNLDSDKLIIRSHNILKKNEKKFRNFIRNYSQFLINERKKILGKSIQYLPRYYIIKKIISLT